MEARPAGIGHREVGLAGDHLFVALLRLVVALESLQHVGAQHLGRGLVGKGDRLVVVGQCAGVVARIDADHGAIDDEVVVVRIERDGAVVVGERAVVVVRAVSQVAPQGQIGRVLGLHADGGFDVGHGQLEVVDTREIDGARIVGRGIRGILADRSHQVRQRPVVRFHLQEDQPADGEDRRALFGAELPFEQLVAGVEPRFGRTGRADAKLHDRIGSALLAEGRPGAEQEERGGAGEQERRAGHEGSLRLMVFKKLRGGNPSRRPVVAGCPSQKTKSLEAGHAVAAHDQMVVYGDAQRPGRLRDLARHVDIGARGRGIARRMVVQDAIGKA